jgi:nitroreductase
MDVFQAVTARRSIRKFKPDPVPEGLLREILEAARWSPSWGNTQPWEIVVVSGDSLDRLKEAYRQKLTQGVVPQPDTPMPEAWPERFKQRYTEVGKVVLTSLGIARGDHEARLRYGVEMYMFFSAPCLMLLCVDKALAREYAMLDVGAIQQTICLLAHARGLGSCILAAAARYPEAIREIVPALTEKAVISGIALGYPDREAAINHFPRERAALDDFTVWIR